MNTIKFTYKVKIWKQVLGGLFFMLCVFVLIMKALWNKEGLAINWVLKLSVEGATIFYWVLVAFCITAVLLSINNIIHVFSQKKREIILTNTSITAPKSGISKTIITVNFAAVKTLKSQKISNEELLIIEHSEGKLIIAKSVLGNKKQFEELRQRLIGKINPNDFFVLPK